LAQAHASAMLSILLPTASGRELFLPALRGVPEAQWQTQTVQPAFAYAGEPVEYDRWAPVPVWDVQSPLPMVAVEGEDSWMSFAGMAAFGAALGVAGSMLLTRDRAPAMLAVEGQDAETVDVEVLEPVKVPDERTVGAFEPDSMLYDVDVKVTPPASKAANKVPARELDPISQTIQGFLDPKENRNLAKMVEGFLANPRLAAASMATGAAMVARPALAAPSPWATSTFFDALDQGLVEKVSIAPSGSELLAIDNDGNRHDVKLLTGEAVSLIEKLQAKNVVFAVQPPQEDSVLDTFGPLLFNLGVPLLLIGGLIAFNARRNQEGGGGMGGPMGGGGPGGMMNMGKGRAKIQMEPDTGVNFDDVAGCDESKLELTELVEFLKNPAKFSKLGAKVPRGALLEGPPGTGKTLLARAVAGEAGVPFVFASGSEFVEMFVGVGASRIRNLFGEAKKNAPCIIFIDEIDAIGRQRAGGGSNMGGGNDEREQTLNQILTEMDGFEGNSGVIVLAATNRGDVLDAALLRPGRFDRRVPVPLPDKKGRLDILKVHSRNKPLEDDVDLDLIAGRTIGFSGASLQNLMNEAAINAARKDKDSIAYAEVDQAIDRLTVGLAKANQKKSITRQRLVAYHEAGHAVMAAMLDDYDSVTKVTILPRSNGAGGFTLFTPSEDRMESGMYSLRFLKDQLAVALGGRVAEELVFGTDEVTTGASGDLQQVRNIARRMVTQWGFAGEKLGMTAWEDAEANQYAGKGVSSKLEAAIDREVSAICKEAYETCYSTLKSARSVMDDLAEQLLEEETVDGKEVDKLVEKFKAESKAAAVPA